MVEVNQTFTYGVF